jgi:hypothetical protein
MTRHLRVTHVIPALNLSLMTIPLCRFALHSAFSHATGATDVSTGLRTQYSSVLSFVPVGTYRYTVL